MSLRKTASIVSIFIAGIAAGAFIREMPSVNAAVENSTSYHLNFKESKGQPNQAFPKSHIAINRSCYSLGYDCRTRNALWVYERLTSESLKGNANRDDFAFREDPLIPQIFRSTLKDYQKSGFDRGHLAPAANHKSSSGGMEDTFYLSNMSPQNPKLNRGYWAKLEKHVRDLTKSYQTVEVFTGPLYLPKEEVDGSKWVKYRVIGENDVAVPTHFFKVLILESKGKRDTVAYILPNEPIASNTSLDQFKTTVKKVEIYNTLTRPRPNIPVTSRHLD